MYSSNAILNLFLQSTGKYSIEQINYIPTGVSGVGIVATILLGWYSDITKARWHVGIFLSFTAIISGALVLNPPTYNAKLFALLLNGCQYAGQTSFFAWANDLCYADDAKRSIILAAMNTFSIVVYMFWSIVFYNTAQSPDWRSGSIAMMCMGSALLVTTLVVHVLEKRDQEKESKRASPMDLGEEGAVVAEDTKI